MTPTAINNSIELKQDSAARQQALDVTRSFLVQAPAGSGKTELLTNRFLALLSVVDEPEQILAITFTRDATAEMRARVLSALQEAAAGDGTVAAAALERSRELGWALLEQPHRLNIQTIDSLCLQIAHEAPLLSRLGGQLQPTEDARPLYELAARRTLEQLGEGDSVISRALQDLLRMRDVNVTECEGLIADLLCNRDQWLAEFPAEALHNESAWESLRPRLEEPLRREHDRVMRRVKELLSRHPLHGRRLFELAAYACGNEPKVPLEDIQELMSVEDMITLAHFKCVRQFLLTGEGGWRKRVDKNHGFPTEKDGGSKEHKDNFGWLIQQLQETEGLLEALCALDELPAERYSDEEWRSIRSIFMVLVHAAAQLRVVFAERSAIDFVEAGMTAEFALHDPEVRRRWSDQIHHLLVDEFQDTSRRQYTLLSSIAGGWEHGEGKTCFLVGDPMQSIYLFRQADLALFNEVRSDGFGDSADAVTFENLSLRRNFRSSAGIVYPLNDMFTEIVGRRGTTAQFAPAVASADSPDKNAVHIFPQFRETGTVNLSGAREAEKAIEIIGRHIPAMERARAEGDAFRVGVLVRAKKHVAPIAAALRDAGIGYRAIEIETLDERQEIRDLLSLVRALLSPLDRIAWLSVLRAPWCGLSLCDLHTLSGSDDKEVMKQPIPELLKTRMALLSNDGAHRAKRIMKTLQLAIGQRFSGEYSASPSGFATWIERTWRSLGGAACVDANALENVGAFFKLLATVTPDGVDASKTLLEQRVARLFAQPATDATERVGVQLMTIHKAKGLGFDVVIVPALERVTGRSETPLLQWMARTREDSDRKELLIAPIGIKGDDSSPTYSWVARQRRKEEEAEQDRLLYVACTRAKSELHLFGTVCVRTTLEDGSSSVKMDVPSKRSLLGTGWPFFEAMFQEHLEKDRAEDRTGIFLVPKRSLETEQGFEMAASTRSAGQSLRRLPAHWKWDGDENSSSSGQPAGSSTIARVTSRRDAQAAGIVLHALFQQMASLDQDDVRRDLSRSGDHWTKVATALLRHAGLSSSEINAQLKRVLMMLQAAADDAHGRWMLGQHAKARSESAWTFLEGAVSRTVRADRVFVAGSEPLKKGESHLWIVDYKSTPIVREDDLFLEQERRRHEAQLATYGRVLRNAHAADLPVMLGLYYPSIPHLLWWPA